MKWMIFRKEPRDMTLGTFVVLIIVGVIVFFAARSLYKDKKKGKSISCGGDCNHCRGCH